MGVVLPCFAYPAFYAKQSDLRWRQWGIGARGVPEQGGRLERCVVRSAERSQLQSKQTEEW